MMENSESQMDRAKRVIEAFETDDGIDSLSEADKDWLCGELLPSLRRHGCYPPPPAGTTAITKNLHNPVREFIERVVG